MNLIQPMYTVPGSLSTVSRFPFGPSCKHKSHEWKEGSGFGDCIKVWTAVPAGKQKMIAWFLVPASFQEQWFFFFWTEPSFSFDLSPNQKPKKLSEWSLLPQVPILRTERSSLRAPGLTRCSLFRHEIHDATEFWSACRSAVSGTFLPSCGSTWSAWGMPPVCGSQVPACWAAAGFLLRRETPTLTLHLGFRGSVNFRERAYKWLSSKSFFLWVLDPNFQTGSKVFNKTPL